MQNGGKIGRTFLRGISVLCGGSGCILGLGLSTAGVVLAAAGSRAATTASSGSTGSISGRSGGGLVLLYWRGGSWSIIWGEIERQTGSKSGVDGPSRSANGFLVATDMFGGAVVRLVSRRGLSGAMGSRLQLGHHRIHFFSHAAPRDGVSRGPVELYSCKKV